MSVAQRLYKAAEEGKDNQTIDETVGTAISAEYLQARAGDELMAKPKLPFPHNLSVAELEAARLVVCLEAASLYFDALGNEKAASAAGSMAKALPRILRRLGCSAKAIDDAATTILEDAGKDIELEKLWKRTGKFVARERRKITIAGKGISGN